MCKGYSLSKDNTHRTVSSHHSEGLENSRSGEGDRGRENSTRWDTEIGHLGKMETQKLRDGTTENTEWPRESTAETFISFYCCKAKPKELESCAFQTINCTCTISLCNLLPQESVAGGFIRTQKGSGLRVPGAPGTAVAMVWKRQEPSCPRAPARPAPRGCAGDHPGLGLANCACSSAPRTSCHRRQGTMLKIMRFGGLSQLPRFVRAMTV